MMNLFCCGLQVAVYYKLGNAFETKIKESGGKMKTEEFIRQMGYPRYVNGSIITVAWR